MESFRPVWISGGLLILLACGLLLGCSSSPAAEDRPEGEERSPSVAGYATAEAAFDAAQSALLQLDVEGLQQAVHPEEHERMEAVLAAIESHIAQIASYELERVEILERQPPLSRAEVTYYNAAGEILATHTLRGRADTAGRWYASLPELDEHILDHPPQDDGQDEPAARDGGSVPSFESADAALQAGHAALLSLNPQDVASTVHPREHGRIDEVLSSWAPLVERVDSISQKEVVVLESSPPQAYLEITYYDAAGEEIVAFQLTAEHKNGSWYFALPAIAED